MLKLVLVVLVAGAVGGVLNALISDNGFALPRRVTVDQNDIIRPGFLGNTLVGAVAAIVSWGLYGPLGAKPIVGGADPGTDAASAHPALTLASMVGALLVGVGGARWLSNEVDKRLLKAAATEAALGRSSDGKAASIAAAPPAQALEIARSLH